MLVLWNIALRNLNECVKLLSSYPLRAMEYAIPDI